MDIKEKIKKYKLKLVRSQEEIVREMNEYNHIRQDKHGSAANIFKLFLSAENNPFRFEPPIEGMYYGCDNRDIVIDYLDFILSALKGAFDHQYIEMTIAEIEAWAWLLGQDELIEMIKEKGYDKSALEFIAEYYDIYMEDQYEADNAYDW
jgi:hypothetical protein